MIDSPWATQYNTWDFNPNQFPDAAGMISTMRSAGVRTVVWATPWVNLDSRDGQIPPQPGSERLHREPASNYAPGAAAGHFVKDSGGDPFVSHWWMGTGSPVDLTSPAAEEWWRAQAKAVLELGVQGVKADDGDGYYLPDHVQLADGRTGAQAAWALGGLHRLSMQRSLDEVHPVDGNPRRAARTRGYQLIDALHKGDRGAFAQIFEQHDSELLADQVPATLPRSAAPPRLAVRCPAARSVRATVATASAPTS